MRKEYRCRDPKCVVVCCALSKAHGRGSRMEASVARLLGKILHELKLRCVIGDSTHERP